MQVIIQVVSSAQVQVFEEKLLIKEEKIWSGILIYFSIKRGDYEQDWKGMIEKFCKKLSSLRFLPNAEGKLINTLQDNQAELMVISNFTLYGSYKKGTKVDFSQSEHYEKSEQIYDFFIERLKKDSPALKDGVFWWEMIVDARNTWPINYIFEI